MPFQSQKQEKYMWANMPDIARRWTKKYGSTRARKANLQEVARKKLKKK